MMRKGYPEGVKELSLTPSCPVSSLRLYLTFGKRGIGTGVEASGGLLDERQEVWVGREKNVEWWTG